MVCGAAGNGSRSTNVCGYFWNDTGCRKSAGKRGRAWNNLGIYDVCDDYFIPVTGDVVKSNQKKLLAIFIGIVCMGIVIVGTCLIYLDICYDKDTRRFLNSQEGD